MILRKEVTATSEEDSVDITVAQLTSLQELPSDDV